MLTPTDPSEIYKTYVNKEFKGFGYDGLLHKVAHHCTRALSVPLSYFINLSSIRGSFPQDMKQTFFIITLH